MITPVQKPDYNNNGMFQFVTGYSGGGAEMCVHLSMDEIIQRLTENNGAGELIIDDNGWWWKQPGEQGISMSCEI